MTSDRWNDAVNDHSLDVASVAFLIDKAVGAVFMDLIRGAAVPVDRLPVMGAQTPVIEQGNLFEWSDEQAGS